MKSLFRIVIRYITTACLISFAILALSFSVYAYSVINYRTTNGIYHTLEKITDGFYQNEENQALCLSEESLEMLKKRFVFAMELDNAGNVIWSYALPDELNRNYSMTDMASMTRWYLEDYPVKVWINPHGIFVAGLPKDSIAKYRLEIASEALSTILILLPAWNLAFILLICIVLAVRLYRSLLPLGRGIENLSENKPVCLKETGITFELAQKLNQASAILTAQHHALKKRDLARTNWIAGVSHDIRTPLSMVMGYAEKLEGNQSLSPKQHREAAIIKEQSLVIRDLIEDLNLTSKLEYQMQPLNQELCSPSAMLRNLIAEYYNQDLPPRYEINLQILNGAEGITLSADKRLLNRAFTNLIGNSIRHNPGGCSITVTVDGNEASCILTFSDTGLGIPQTVTDYFSEGQKDLPEGQHIMGLNVVSQITAAHKGSFHIRDSKSIELNLPVYDMRESSFL